MNIWTKIHETVQFKTLGKQLWDAQQTACQLPSHLLSVYHHYTLAFHKNVHMYHVLLNISWKVPWRTAKNQYFELEVSAGGLVAHCNLPCVMIAVPGSYSTASNSCAISMIWVSLNDKNKKLDRSWLAMRALIWSSLAIWSFTSAVSKK